MEVHISKQLRPLSDAAEPRRLIWVCTGCLASQNWDARHIWIKTLIIDDFQK